MDSSGKVILESQTLENCKINEAKAKFIQASIRQGGIVVLKTIDYED